MLATTNLRTGKRRVYIDGKRVSEATFNQYRAIGCFFNERTKRVRRAFAVGVKKGFGDL